MINRRFFLAIFITLLWVISSYLAIIFNFTKYQDVLRLATINYHDAVFLKYRISVKESHYQIFLGVLWIISLLTTGLITYGFIKNNFLRREWISLKGEIKQKRKNLVRLVINLSRFEKILAISILFLLLLLRLFYFQNHYFTTDEVASYDFFVTEGLLAVISYYPIPNNHILSNSLSLLFYQLFTDTLLVMRGPVLIISLVGTVIIYLGLIRLTGFAVATFGISIFCFSQMGLTFAIFGRGYFLLLIFSFVNFYALLRLMYMPAASRFNFFLFITTGILGFYTVLTFFYSFVATLAFGIIHFSYKRAKGKILELIISGLIVSIGSLFLYLPVLFISGPDSLLNNGYIQPENLHQFWSRFPLYFSYTEGILLGQERLGKYFIGLVLLLSLARILDSKERSRFIKFAFPGLVMVLLPYFIVGVQRVYTPERALLFKAIYAYTVAGILFFWVTQKFKIAKQIKIMVVSFLIVLYASYQVFNMQQQQANYQVAARQRLETFLWLKRSRPQKILVLDAFYGLYLNHHFKLGGLNCTVYSDVKATELYDFIIVSKKRPANLANLPAGSCTQVYQNDFVTIFNPR